MPIHNHAKQLLSHKPNCNTIDSNPIIGCDFDVEGDIFAAFALFDVIFNRTLPVGQIVSLADEVLALPGSGPARPAGRGPSQLSGTRHSRERDRAAIQYHYNVGNDFYALWLDRRMQ